MHASRFNAIVAYAPLVQPNTSPFPYDVAVAIGWTMDKMGIGEDWAPTLEATFDEAYAESGALHSTTTSYSRWRRSKDNCVRHKVSSSEAKCKQSASEAQAKRKRRERSASEARAK